MNSTIKHQSIWDPYVKKKNYEALESHLHVDVVIVGGGITGITAAKLLSESGKKVALLEQYTIGSGTTGHSTGNLYATTGQHLASISSKHNEETMIKVAQSRLEALQLIKKLVLDNELECDFKTVPWHLFTTTKPNTSVISDEHESASKAGLSTTTEVPSDFPFPCAAILSVNEQAQLNPLQYIQHLAATLNDRCQIFENSKVIDILDGTPCKVKTIMGSITADHIILATHSPLGLYAVQSSMKVKREYAIAVKLKTDLPIPAIYWDYNEHDDTLFSTRTYENKGEKFLLTLHERHEVGHNAEDLNYPQQIEQYIRSYFDVEDVHYVWSAQKYSSLDKLPYIGKSPVEQHTYYATGFAADGLIYGTLAAMLIKDDILGIENPWAKTYNPRIPALGSVPKIIKHNMEVFGDMVVDFLTSPSSELSDLQLDEGKVTKINGKHMAVYKNPEGWIYALSAICPHMGCTVHWNNFEKSWDCPCHGSRFKTDGEVIEGPAIKGLHVHQIKKDPT